MTAVSESDVLVTVPAPHDLTAAWPEQPQQLFLLFHGIGQKPADMRGLAQRLAQQFPQGIVACIAAPQAHDEGEGFQWYSPRGITEANRPARMEPAIEAFVATVHAWQKQAGLGADRTALVCYSQAAMVGLEAVAQKPHFCARLFAIAGRFATLPQAMHAHTSIHWLHGKQDKVQPCQAAAEAAQRLKMLDADFSVDVFADAGHRITDEMEQRVLHLLQNHVPKRLWREALGGAGSVMQDPASLPPKSAGAPDATLH